MPAKRKRATNDDIVDKLDTLIMVVLGLSGVSQWAIREIAQVDQNRMSKVVKLLKSRHVKGDG